MEDNIRDLLKNFDSIDNLNYLLEQTNIIKYIDKLNSGELTELISGYKLDEIKISLITKFKDNLSFNDTIKILKTISNDKYKLELINEYSDLSKKMIIISTLESDTLKIEQIDLEDKTHINFESIISILESIKNEEIKDKLAIHYSEQYKDCESLLVEIITYCSDEEKIKFFEEHKNIDAYYKAKVLSSIKDISKRKNVILKNFMNDFTVFKLVTDNFSDNEKYDLLINNDNISFYDMLDIIDKISSFNIRKELFDNEKFKLRIIQDNEFVSMVEETSLSKDLIYEYFKANFLTDEEKIKFIDSYNLKVGGEIIYGIICMFESDNLKIEYIIKYEKQLSIHNISLIILNIKSDDKKIDLIKKFNFNEEELLMIIRSIKDDAKKINLIETSYPNFSNLNVEDLNIESYPILYKTFITKIENDKEITLKLLTVLYQEQEKFIFDFIDRYQQVLKTNDKELLQKYDNYINNHLGDFIENLDNSSLKNHTYEEIILKLLELNIKIPYQNLKYDLISDKLKVKLLPSNWNKIEEQDKIITLLDNINNDSLKENILKKNIDYNLYCFNDNLKKILFKLVKELDNNKKIEFIAASKGIYFEEKVEIIESIQDNNFIINYLLNNYDVYETKRIILNFENESKQLELFYIIVNKIDIYKEVDFLLSFKDYFINKIDFNYLYNLIKKLLGNFKQKTIEVFERVSKYLNDNQQMELFKLIDEKDLIMQASFLSLSNDSIISKMDMNYLYNLIYALLNNENIEKSINLFDKVNKYLNNEKLDVLFKNLKMMKLDVAKTYLNYIEIEKINLLSIEEINNLANIVFRISNSNSLEIQRLQVELINSLKGLSSNEIPFYLNKIENMFLRNNLPMGIKLFEVYKIIHPDKTYFSQGFVYSPILKSNDLSLEEKHSILMGDMLKVTLNSNPYDIYRYLDNMQNEMELLRKLLKIKQKYPEKKYSVLDEETRKSIDKIIQIVEAWGFVYGFNHKDATNEIYDYLNENMINGIENWLVSLFCTVTEIPFNSIAEIKAYIANNIEKINERNKKRANDPNYKFILAPGDLIKGISKYENYLLSMLENGINCQEFLGANAGADTTNLDTDFSMINKETKDIGDAMGGTTAEAYSKNLWIVLKNVPDRFNVTNRVVNDKLEKKSNYNPYDARMELFKINNASNDNYGIRSGVPSTEIDFIICDTYNDWIGHAIAMNGFYIPVVNKSGNLVFTPSDYDKIREKMQGLDYYYCSDIEISENTYMRGLDPVVDIIRQDKIITNKKLELVRKIIGKGLKEIGYDVRYDLGTDLLSEELELIGTGSTERGNNKPGDCDFDYMLRIDTEKFTDKDKLQEIVSCLNDLCKSLGGTPNGGNCDTRLRYQNVNIDGIDEPIDIDISFIKKINKIEYSSDACLRDKMNNIDRVYGKNADYVRANIILAKAILKNNKIYKKVEHNGIGGIGVENWILQNNGSLIDAIETFVETAEKYPNIEDFVRHYPIYDFGENFYSKELHGGHDNFIESLKDKTTSSNQHLEKMKNALKNFKQEYKKAIQEGLENEYISNILNGNSNNLTEENKKKI